MSNVLANTCLFIRGIKIRKPTKESKIWSGWTHSHSSDLESAGYSQMRYFIITYCLPASLGLWHMLVCVTRTHTCFTTFLHVSRLATTAAFNCPPTSSQTEVNSKSKLKLRKIGLVLVSLFFAAESNCIKSAYNCSVSDCAIHTSSRDEATSAFSRR